MNQRQNEVVEKIAQDAAAANRPADWRLTPISETQGARVTCPFRNNGFVPDGWWEKTEPRYPDGTPVLGPTAPDPFLESSRQNKRSKGYGRDSAASRSAAIDRASYYGTRISENLARTPEGYLLCHDAVIGRTGFQTYLAKEITDPAGLLKKYGNYGPDDPVELYRSPEEVFSDATLASFEGKTFTITHPSDLLNRHTEQSHHEGHVQNVRPGTEPLDSGDWPMLADVIITGADAIRAIESGARELSCGYTYELTLAGHRWEQRKILGNHVALVEKGRAGAAAKIYDTAPKQNRRRN
jgi:Uncharacterized protein conserved in bacteria (DUF2213)